SIQRGHCDVRSLTKAKSDFGQRGAGAGAAEDGGTKMEKAEERKRRKSVVAIGRRKGRRKRRRSWQRDRSIEKEEEIGYGRRIGAIPSMLTFVGMLSAFIRLGGVMFLPVI
ncbi:hypothetical protein BHM03_00060641, partial [Ensete ventricosum]